MLLSWGLDFLEAVDADMNAFVCWDLSDSMEQLWVEALPASRDQTTNQSARQCQTSWQRQTSVPQHSQPRCGQGSGQRQTSRQREVPPASRGGWERQASSSSRQEGGAGWTASGLSSHTRRASLDRSSRTPPDDEKGARARPLSFMRIDDSNPNSGSKENPAGSPDTDIVDTRRRMRL